MKVITTRQIRNETKTYFELAEKERIAVKRGDKYVNLVVTDNPEDSFLDKNWIKDFFAIPEEFRSNPFDISPSGDLFWADKRNVEVVQKAVKGKTSGIKINSKDDLQNFLDSCDNEV